tara:strand:+ start:3131 stop:3505 length:375 start_codon:yes stop_codon:yes gene_type:complete
MKTIQKRFLAFLLLCIPMRIIFALVAKYINNDYLPYLGFLAIMPAIGFSYIFIFGKRKKGGETFGQKIWWNHLRPIHALLYALFAYLAINKNKNSHFVLFADVFIGFVSFLHYHYSVNSFSKLF